MEWIDVNDRLPPRKYRKLIVDVILMNGKRETDVTFNPRLKRDIRFYKYKDFNLPCVRTTFLVTHWMPLPEPPK